MKSKRGNNIANGRRNSRLNPVVAPFVLFPPESGVFVGGGSGVSVGGGCGVSVGGSGVLVGGLFVLAGFGVFVSVGGSGVGELVGGRSGVSDGTGVSVSGIGVSVGSGVNVSVGSGVWVGNGVDERVAEGIAVCVGGRVGVRVAVGLPNNPPPLLMRVNTTKIGRSVFVGVGEIVAVVVGPVTKIPAPEIVGLAETVAGI